MGRKKVKINEEKADEFIDRIVYDVNKIPVDGQETFIQALKNRNRNIQPDEPEDKDFKSEMKDLVIEALATPMVQKEKKIKFRKDLSENKIINKYIDDTIYGSYLKMINKHVKFGVCYSYLYYKNYSDL